MVVLSRGEPELPAAVGSLLQQSPRPELVVSHSGPSSVDELLASLRGVRLVSSPAPRTPGAARNAGVAATAAPWVAFLAADCQALPGWVEGRVRRHRAGAPAVASAMVPPRRGPAPLAAHLLRHSTRMPHVPAAPVLRFGVSYSRELLDRLGPFDEDMAAEEDVEMNARLIRAGIVPELAPDVRTADTYPASLRVLLRDSVRRGRQRHAMRGSRRPRVVLAARALADAPAGALRAAAPNSGVDRALLAAALPHLTLAGVAGAAGVLTAPRQAV